MSVSLRETKIYITDDEVLFPSEALYPSDMLFPGCREITNISAGTLKLDEMISEKTPQFGQLYSTKFECQIYLEEDLSGKRIAVYQKDNNNILHSVFMGKIESCKTDRIGTDRTIVAYDQAYWANSTNVATWWSNFWQNKESATLKQVRDSLLDYVDISSEDVTLPNDTLVVHKDVSLTSCTFQQMLRMICELNCCFPHIDREGMMNYILLDPEDTPTSLDGLYEWMNSNFEEYVTDTITGIQFFDSDDQLKYNVGDTENAYPIKKNIFLYNAGTSTLISVGNTMLTYLETLTYNPATIKMIVADLELHLGTCVEAEGHKFYVFQNSYSGSQFVEQTVKAEGDKTLYSGTAHLNYGELILNEKISRVHQDVEEFYIEYGEYKEEEAIKESTYHGAYVPTDENYPANEWTTTVLKEAHLEEVFYNTATQKYYKWTKTETGDPPVVTYSWQEIGDLGYGRTLSLYRQNASQILMKVSKGTVSSELSLEPGRITIGTGRLEINSTNFTLDTDGNMTAKSAVLENATITSNVTVGSGVNIDESEIEFTYNGTSIGTLGTSYGQHGSGYRRCLDMQGENLNIHASNFVFIDGTVSVNGNLLNVLDDSNYSPIQNFTVDIEPVVSATFGEAWSSDVGAYVLTIDNSTWFNWSTTIASTALNVDNVDRVPVWSTNS